MQKSSETEASINNLNVESMRRDLRNELINIIPPEKIIFLSRSFDVIGSKGRAVAVIEIVPELSSYEREIA